MSGSFVHIYLWLRSRYCSHLTTTSPHTAFFLCNRELIFTAPSDAIYSRITAPAVNTQ